MQQNAAMPAILKRQYMYLADADSQLPCKLGRLKLAAHDCSSISIKAMVLTE
jgi:hypothetical protein